MLMAHDRQNVPSDSKNLFPYSKSFYNFLIFGAILAVSGCQYFNFGQPTAFSATQSGSSALMHLKPNRVAQTRTVPAPVTSVSVNPYIGNAAYICSPSGFGQQSHCFQRSAGPLSAQTI
ncbi:MAG: hypothetical protein EOQ57_12560 [Mesorhizobium sp.]|uniref:hypothetical protein n=1 Tax=Mesorhizobium sp. TaxID=1871066 RepID=UPI000FE80ABC|nr:hypothetical protein [Mesorhizobium sp.]RWC01791.1 MAG: hypothetical protein EOQ57_12560 [Mesorhizobium sp.]